jgi:AcrR family transcriptional regulator
VSDARQALLDKVLAHAAEHGISDLSLRQLASDIGTSHRMLIYHFGSREGLVAAIVAAVEARQRAAMQELSSRVHTPSDLVRALWQQVADPQLRPFVRLFFEVLAHAFQRRPGTEGFLDQLTAPSLTEGREAAANVGLDPPVSDVRLGVALIRGLLIEVLATGDDAGATESLERFIAMWEADIT